jgi:hypothetical protein
MSQIWVLGIAGQSLVQKEQVQGVQGLSKSKFEESREEAILGATCRTYIFCHLYRLGT